MNRFLNVRRDNRKSRNPNPSNSNFAYKLQLSDWMLQKPTDIHNWILVPCPKGKRCLLVARDGYTSAYSKIGNCFKKFRSSLPGDFNLNTSISIFDAIFDTKSNTFYILDVLSYGYQDMINCEASFRFFWRKSKIEELELGQTRQSNTYPMISLDYYDLAEDDDIIKCLSSNTFFKNSSTELDGLLFYHKEASYTHGITPLVGWLFPFMLEEVIGMRFNDERLNKFPSNYTNYLDYIEYFNKKQTQIMKKRMNFNTDKNSKMNYESEACINKIIEHEKNLEMDIVDDLISPQALDDDMD